MPFAAGQSWTYRAPEGFELSRIVIGAIVTFAGNRNVICCSVLHAPRIRSDGRTDTFTVPFLPLTEDAFKASVELLDGSEAPHDEFADHLRHWSEDPKGQVTFTVPFEGLVDHMIARQMAEIAGRSAAA